MIPNPQKRGRKRKQIIIDNSEPTEKRRNIRIIKAVKMNIDGTDYYVSGENHPVHILVYDVTTHLCVGALLRRWNDAPLSDSTPIPTTTYVFDW